jgi:predicted TPR repeat methyltransferase
MLTIDELLQQGLELHQSGELDSAAISYEQVLSLQPEHADALHLMGLIHFAQDDTQAAANMIRLAIASNANEAVFHFNLGNICRAAGELDAAIVAFETAIELQSDESDYFNNLGNALEDKGELDHAMESYQCALALSPDDAELYFNLGNVLRGLGRIDAARTAYTQSLELAPDYVPARSTIAELLIEQGDIAQACVQYEQALTLAPQDVALWVDLGATLQRLGQRDRAVTCFEQALQLDPKDPRALNNLGGLRQAAGDVDGALECYRSALAADPELAEAHRNYAGLLQANGAREEAITHYQEALRLKTDYAEVAYILASLRGDKAPVTAPTEYVAALFDQYADEFDEHLTGVLKYRTPQALRDMFDHIVQQTGLHILDLGCGTGLAGVAFKDLAKELAGIDLSPRMIEKAAERGIYDTLGVDDVVSALNERPGHWELLVAADVFVYIGDCDAILAAARIALGPGGFLLFSVEHGDTADFTLREEGRYAHSSAYFQRLADQHGFVICAQERTVLRQNHGVDVHGWLYAMQTEE